jgi:hypothetical protein
VALAPLGLVVGLAAFAQEGTPPAPPDVGPDAAPDLEAMAKLAQPGPHHERLARAAGTWSVSGKFWMAEGQPPMESMGESTITPVLGGRFMKHEYTSSFMDQPFIGLGLDGYDNLKQKYVSLWTDTWGTGFYLMEGTLDPKTGVITMLGEWPNPAGGTMKVKSESRHNDDGSMTYAMFDEKGGAWHKTMELVYRRNGPTKEAALQLLRDVLAALEAKDTKKAASYFALPAKAPLAEVEKELGRFIERRHISAAGIQILGERGKWGRLEQAFGPEEAARVAKSYEFDVEAAWGFSLGRAAAAFVWDGKTLKVAIFDDIGTLE